MCRTKTKLHNFDKLERGDHVQIKGRTRCVGNLYSHHAIISDVSNITDNRRKADVQVIDVSQKNKESCCSQKSMKAVNHKLYDEDQVKCSRLSRLDYRKRRHDTKTTFERAQNRSFTVKYCFCMRNCEHFANACVGGKDSLDDDEINNSISLQSTACCWRITSALIQLVQFCFYIINFYIYAVFVANNDKFKRFPDGLTNLLNKTCHRPNNSYRGFDTACDWIILGICVIVFSLLFVTMFLRLYFKFYKKKYMCKQCLLSAGCVYAMRIGLFIVFDICNIFLEKPLYQLSLRETEPVLIVIVVIVAVVEGLLIYILAHYITKLLLYGLGKSWCCSSCCGVEIEEDSYRYAMSHF